MENERNQFFTGYKIKEGILGKNKIKIVSKLPDHVSTLKNPPEKWKFKKKKNKCGLIKLKSFCTPRETINNVKRQPSEWEKTIANETTDEGLISKIYKQLM